MAPSGLKPYRERRWNGGAGWCHHGQGPFRASSLLLACRPDDDRPLFAILLPRHAANSWAHAALESGSMNATSAQRGVESQQSMGDLATGTGRIAQQTLELSTDLVVGGARMEGA